MDMTDSPLQFPVYAVLSDGGFDLVTRDAWMPDGLLRDLVTRDAWRPDGLLRLMHIPLKPNPVQKVVDVDDSPLGLAKTLIDQVEELADLVGPASRALHVKSLEVEELSEQVRKLSEQVRKMKAQTSGS
jgi:hypothetical protein